MKYFSILLCILFVTNLEAQSKKDSLWKVWNDPAAQDTNRLKAIQALTWPMLSVDLDSALILANMELDFAKKVNSKKWISKAYYNIGTHYYLKSDFVRSLANYQQSLELRKELGDLKGEAAIYGNIGLIYGQQGNVLKELQYQLKALEINKQINDTANLTSNYANLAIIYQNQEDTAKALEYYRQALAMHDAQNDKQSIAIVYNNIGTMYRTLKQFDKALDYLYKSLQLRNELGDKLGTAITYVNLGTVYTSMKDYDNAKKYTYLSIDAFEEYGDTASLANGYYNLGDISLLQNKYADAVKWCTLALDISEAARRVPIEQAACSCLYRGYKGLGNNERALYYFEQYVVLTDSLKQEDLKIELNRLEFEKDLLTDSLSREEEKNQLRLGHQAEIARKNRVTYIILFIGLGVLMLALVFLSRMLVFHRNSEKLKLKTQDLEKQQLVNEISLLKTQVNPHFLFNSLSILSSLVRIDPDLSERFIDQLSRSYRYILEQKDQSLVTLRTELSFIDSYAFLLKIRFENKFNLNITIPPEALDKYKIAPLTLQLLVENAVKHNRMSVTEPLIINISLEGDVLIVKNKLQPRATEYKSTGVGLQNIMNRYALLTNRQVIAGESGDEFVVKIPILNSDSIDNF